MKVTVTKEVKVITPKMYTLHLNEEEYKFIRILVGRTGRDEYKKVFEDEFSGRDAFRKIWDMAYDLCFTLENNK
jgi:hypothetical protein